jgi:hypothetical protein
MLPAHLITPDVGKLLGASLGRPTRLEAHDEEALHGDDPMPTRPVAGPNRTQRNTPRAKSFDAKADAERWARTLEAELDRSGALADTRLETRMTVRQLLERYLLEITPTKRSASSESYRIKALIGQDIAYWTLALLSAVAAATEQGPSLRARSLRLGTAILVQFDRFTSTSCSRSAGSKEQTLEPALPPPPLRRSAPSRRHRRYPTRAS